MGEKEQMPADESTGSAALLTKNSWAKPIANLTQDECRARLREAERLLRAVLWFQSDANEHRTNEVWLRWTDEILTFMDGKLDGPVCKADSH